MHACMHACMSATEQCSRERMQNLSERVSYLSGL